MSVFAFVTDAESEDYCLKICQKMTTLFGIGRDEAIGRVNQAFAGQTIVGDDLAFYHETVEYWAKSVCYEPGAYWWVDESSHKLRAYP